MKRVLVCGGRDYADRNALFNALYSLCEERGWQTTPDEYGNWLPAITIIHGNAPGADLLADDFAVVNWTGLQTFPANWREHGKAAGPIRNQRMLDEGKPDLVVAFSGGRGTADMVRRATAAGVEVVAIAAAARQSGDAKQAPSAGPQSGHEVASPKGGSHA